MTDTTGLPPREFDGLRRRHRRRRPRRAFRGNPAEDARPESLGGGGREGIDGRRAHLVGRRHRPGRARPAEPRLAKRPGMSAQDPGERRPFLFDDRDRRGEAAELADAAADEQPRQFRRLAGRGSRNGWGRARRASESRSTRGLPRPSFSSATRARLSASRPETWASDATASRSRASRAGWS